MSTQQNPSAFPQTQKLMNDGFPDTVITEVSGGMTLRDYFAAKAMQGIVATDEDQQHYTVHIIAAWAYEIADAMLAQRNQPTDKPNK